MKPRLKLLLLCLSLFAAGISPAGGKQANGLAQQTSHRSLLVIGGDSSDLYPSFIAAALERAADRALGNVRKILLLPVGMGSLPGSLSSEALSRLEIEAERRLEQIQQACDSQVQAPVICQVELAPAWDRPDAESAELCNKISSDLSAIFLFGENPTAMIQVLSGSRLEQALASAYSEGVVIAGAGESGSLLSALPLVDYQAGFGISDALNFGAANVWRVPGQTGLNFGIQAAMIEPQIFQQNRLGLLLNAISAPDSPHLGIGVDGSTGIRIDDENSLVQVFGLYTTAILDAETYHSSAGVHYAGAANTLSLRNVLIHLLSPGESTYDIRTRRHSLASPALAVERSFQMLNLPPGAGTIYLVGDLAGQPAGSPILNDFFNRAGGAKASLLVIPTGYPDRDSAQLAAGRVQRLLHLSPSVRVEAALPPALNPDQDLAGYSGIVLLGEDQALLQPENLPDIRSAWLSGTPILATNAATVLLGQFFSAHAPTPSEGEAAGLAAQRPFIQGKTIIQPGLGLLGFNLEPEIHPNNRWGRIFSLAYAHPELIALGLNRGAAARISEQGVLSLGDEVIFTLDLRQASLSLGTNQGLVIANGLLDVYAPGEWLLPETADIRSAPVQAATPVFNTATATSTAVITATPTASPTITPTPPPPTNTPKGWRPTRTPRPTGTPVPLPPPADMRQINLMIIFGIGTVVVILIGIWLNRPQSGL